MSDVRIVALHKAEREWLLKQLVKAVLTDKPDVEMRNDIAEMLLRAKRADEFGGLNDA